MKAFGKITKHYAVTRSVKRPCKKTFGFNPAIVSTTSPFFISNRVGNVRTSYFSTKSMDSEEFSFRNLTVSNSVTSCLIRGSCILQLPHPGPENITRAFERSISPANSSCVISFMVIPYRPTIRMASEKRRVWSPPLIFGYFVMRMPQHV